MSPQLPSGQSTPESHRYPFWQLASQGKYLYRAIPLERSWYNVWNPGRLAKCHKIHEKYGTVPDYADMLRVMDDYYVSANGNHRMAFFDQIGYEKVVARFFIVHYEMDVLRRAILRELDNGQYDMWVYKNISEVPGMRYGINWYRELIRKDQYEWLYPLWTSVKGVKGWYYYARRDAAKFLDRGKVVEFSLHSYEPYHSLSLRCDRLLEEF